MQASEQTVGTKAQARHAAEIGEGQRVIDFVRRYAVLLLIAVLFVTLSLATDSFLTTTNLLNIANQNAPLAIIAIAGTFVIIGGGFDLSRGGVGALAHGVAAWGGVR